MAMGDWGRQVVVLSQKNLRLQARNKVATLVQVGIGVFFLLLLLVMHSAVQAVNERDQYMTQTLEPRVINASAFRGCWAGDSGCVDLVFSPAAAVTSAAANETLFAVMAHVERLLGASTVLHMASADAMHEWLRANPNTTAAALYFEDVDSWDDAANNSDGGSDEAPPLSYVLEANMTKQCTALGAWGCDDPMAEVAVPLQTAVDAALVTVFGDVSTAEIKAGFSDFPHPDLPASVDVVGDYGPSFLYIAVSFNYVIQFTLLVEEKELHLVEAMRQMGMHDSAYWTSWLLVNTAINTAMVVLLVAFGNLFGLEIFTETATGLTLSFFWLSSMSFTALAFLFSTLTRSTSTARLMGIGTFVVTFIGAPIIVSLILANADPATESLRSILSMFPVFTFYFVLQQFVDSSSGATNTGMRWADRSLNLLSTDASSLEPGQDPSFWSVQSSMAALVKGFFLLCALAWYLDHVIPTEHGKREPLYFIVNPRFWFPNTTRKLLAPKKHKTKRKGGPLKAGTKVAPAEDDKDDADVKAEALAAASGDFGDRDVAVRIQDLRKTFRGGLFKPSFQAVRGIDMGIDKDSLLCLLGHNGAGKSTLLKMLHGVSDITSGDATVLGYSVANDMTALRSKLGVCPQHDILWAKLTAAEHLRLFATLKGLPSGDVEAEVKRRLEQTSLTAVADKPSGSFSGGMQRRLSLAMALVGEPELLILDEPTSGMDVENRRDVWKMIADAKKGRVIILTTHSMEECDVLSDRVACMSRGRIQAIGTSLRLKAKYGNGYRLTAVLSGADKKPGLVAFAANKAPPGCMPIGDTASTSPVLELQLPRGADNGEVAAFLEALEASQDALGVTGFGMQLSTLEDVFLALSQADHFIEEPAPGAPGAATPAVVVKSGADVKPVGTWRQFSALLRKSARFQLQQKASCYAVVLFPVVVMALLLLVELLVFSALRVEALCGANVSKADCLDLGYDLECVARFAEMSFPSAPAPLVGAIDEGGRFGGVNPNCDANGCFDDLEQPLYAGIPVHAPAELVAGCSAPPAWTATSQEQEWLADLAFLLLNSTCEDALQDRLDVDVGCEGVAGAALRECQAVLGRLSRALDYAENVNGTELSLTAAVLGLCSRSETGELATPEQDDLDTAAMLLAERDECSEASFLEVWAHFAEMPASILGNDDGIMANSTSTGTTSTSNKLPGSCGLSEVLNGASSNGMVDRIIRDFAERLMRLGAQVDDPGALGAALSAAGLSGAAAGAVAANVVGLVGNLDALRGLSFDASFASNEDLRLRGMFEQWGGRLVETPRMQARRGALSDSARHLGRQFWAHWAAYEVAEADLATGRLAYTAFYNNSGTRNTKQGNWHALVLLLDGALVKAATGRALEMKSQPLPSRFECNRDAWLRGEAPAVECDLLPRFLQLSILDFIAITLFPYLLMAHLFMVVNLVVYEKENRLRMIMKMMGLSSSSVYWAVNYAFYLAQYSCMVGMMALMGTAADINMFTLHDSMVVFLFLFTWGNLLVVFSFFLSAFFKSSRTSTASCFLLVLVLNTTGANLMQTLTEDANSTEASFTALMFVPPLVMLRGLLWIGLAGAFNEPITMANWATYGDGVVRRCVGLMWVHIIVLSFAVWYLDHVLAVGLGVPDHPLFLFRKSFWGFGGASGSSEAALKAERQGAPEFNQGGGDVGDDVKAEQAEADKGEALVCVSRLHKRYTTKSSDAVAVKSISLAIQRSECLALLGSNGAGKSSTISILSGLFPPTAGSASICGLSILRDLPRIHSQMGVCPQHDILWNCLNAKDHLRFYGRLKGLSGRKLQASVAQALQDVNLSYAAHRPAGTYSGGMKRRLSTAMALVGNPAVVILDEPSTGLDPASRRQLVSVIQRAKGSKSICLTTHNLDEAEMLGDRVAIMDKGLLKCIGRPMELKQRFGKGYTCSITTKDGSQAAHDRIKAFVTSMYPSATLRNRQISGTSNFEIDRKEMVLSKAFRELHNAAEEQDIVDWALASSSLEDVFISVVNSSATK